MDPHVASRREADPTAALAEMVARFAREQIAPRARELDESETFCDELTQQMADLGLLAMIAPPEFGGGGLSYLAYCVAVEELAKVDASQAATVAAHNSLGLAPIVTYGSAEQKQRLLPELCTGAGLWGFALTEPDAGSDARASKTRATYDAASRTWSLSGAKIWITNSACPRTRGVTVLAVTGTEPDGRPELSCFLVDADSPGLTAKPMRGKMMWRASNTGQLFLDNVQVPQENMLGQRGQGFRIMMRTLDSGRLSIAAMGVGLAAGALDLTLTYARQRRTFGRALAEHQAIAFKLADMATRTEAATQLLRHACQLRDSGQPYAREAAMAKLFASEVAEFCAREGQQTFGGYGLMKEYPIERHYRDAALLRIGEGTSEIQRLVIARHLGC